MSSDNDNKQPMLQLEGVGKWFGDFCALWDINLALWEEPELAEVFDRDWPLAMQSSSFTHT